VLLKGSITVGLAIGIGQIYFRIDVLLLAAIRDSEEVGLYGAAVKLIELSELAAAAIGISVFPLLARFARENAARTGRLFQRTFDLLLAVAVPFVVVMTVAAEPLIVLISGPEFAEAGEALRLLAPYVLLSFVTGLAWRALIAYDEERPLVALACMALALNVALNLVVLPEYGMHGAAATSVVSETAAVVAALALLRRRHGIFPSVRYGIVVAPAGAAMALVLALLAGPILVRAGVATAVYAALLLVLPGTVRMIATDNLLPSLRRALARHP
jgi:O-antigen/teichoic acid export membrane protein